MTRRRSSPLGLELVLSVVLVLVVLPLLSYGAPVQDGHTDLHRLSEGCYYNYNHYSEGDRILTNEPCLNCTCHNRMLMCYLRVCPFTKPIGHDCTVEKREDQCCPIITCPEVPVDVTHHNYPLATHTPGTELSIPEKYGCSIDRKFYPEGAQVPSNPNKPCELCYCIRNRTSCLMQECTLHIDGCQPIYNKGSCCPVRYNCDHENELLELEDYSTTTTTVRPTPGYILSSTTSPAVTTDCIHNNEVYADGASITGKNACEHCYCMRGDIVCAVQECEMPTLESGAKTCRALPPVAGECCPSNYICDETISTEATLIQEALTTVPPKVQGNLHESVSQEDVQLQEHIDDKIAATEAPEKIAEHTDLEQGSGADEIPEQTLATPGAPSLAEVINKIEISQEEEESPQSTTVSPIKETIYQTTQSPIDTTATEKTEGIFEGSHIIIDHDKEYDATQAPIEDELVTDDKEGEIVKDVTTAAPIVIPEDEEEVPSKEAESTTTSAESSEEEETKIEKDATTTTAPKDLIRPEVPSIVSSADEQKPDISIDGTTISSIILEPIKADITTEIAAEEEQASSTDTTTPSKVHIIPDSASSSEEEESLSQSAEPSKVSPIPQTQGEDKIDQDIAGLTTPAPVYEMVSQGEDSDIVMPEIGDHKYEATDEEQKPIVEAEISAATAGPAVSESDDVNIEDLQQIAVINEEEEIATSKPLSTVSSIKPEGPETEVVFPEHGAIISVIDDYLTTSRPSIVKGEGALAEENEMPGIVPTITGTSSKPIPDGVPEGESQEDQTSSDEAAGITTASSVADVQKETEESDSTTIASSNAYADEDKIQGKPEQGITDSSFIAPSLTEIGVLSSEDEHSSEAVSEESTPSTIKIPSAPSISSGEESISEEEVDKEDDQKQPGLGATDSTTIASSVDDLEITIAGEEDIKKQPTGFEEIKGKPEQDTIDSTTSAPSVADLGVPNAEKEELEGVKGQPELGVTDSTIIAPSVADLEITIAGEEDIKKQPEQDTTDSTTIAPPPADSGVPSTGYEEIKGKPEQDKIDSTTSAPSVADLGAPSSEKEEQEEGVKGQPELGVTDSTIIIPSVSDSGPIIVKEEDIKKKPEQDTADLTTTAPSVADSGAPSTGYEEIKGKPEQDITSAPSVADLGAPSSEEEEPEEGVKGQPELGVTDSTIIIPSVSDSGITIVEEDGIKKQQEQDTADLTTATPSVSDTEASSASDSIFNAPSLSGILSAEAEQSSEESTSSPSKDSITLAPSLSSSEEAVSEEVVDKDGDQKQPELGVTDSAIIVPSVSDSGVIIVEEDNIKKQQEQTTVDSTSIAPSAADLEVTIAEENIKYQPEQITDDSTTTSPIAESEVPTIIEEEIKTQPEDDSSDTTTIISLISDSNVPSTLGEEIKKQPEEVSTIVPSIASSEIAIAAEEEIKEKLEQSSPDSTTIVPSLIDSETATAEEGEIKGPLDSTTIAPSIADSEAPSVGGEKIKEQTEQGISESTFVAPSLTESGALSGEDESSSEISSEESTPSPSKTPLPSPSAPSLSGGDETFSEEEDFEEGQKQPELGAIDSTTIASAVAESEEPSTGYEQIKGKPEAESTTSAPSIADLGVPNAEKEGEGGIKGQPELGIADATTVSPSVADSETPTAEKEKNKLQPEQGTTDLRPIPAVAIDSEEFDKQKPVPSPDEESLEDVGAIEGSGEPTHEIIPSAIPGEGDCLVNKITFAHNASVPSSNECELSCSCLNSIVVCQKVQCYDPPKPNNCILDETSTDRCCPEYICGVDSFADDQRPVTTEEIEDEEIQYTTLSPAIKYPVVSGGTEEQAPVKPISTINESEEVGSEEDSLDRTTRKPEEELLKPVLGGDKEIVIPADEASTEISTPASVDIELPAIISEQPMSHIKDGVDQEESTELSFSAEGSGEDSSDEKIQPVSSITAKPTQEVIADSEEPVQVTAVPDLSALSKKPSVVEESTTLKAVGGEGEQPVTVAPLEQGIVDTPTESGKPTIGQEDFSTKPSIGGDVPKIDENIFNTDKILEIQPTTIRPVELEIASVAPSLSSVLALEDIDSSQSEETTGQTSNESGEETTDSDESTKLPLYPEGPVTTASPITFEQSTIKTIHTDLAGEIAFPESSTIISEGDYQKPELPEDMSHTKIESEQPFETVTKKPLEPVSGKGSAEGEESEEIPEKAPEEVIPPTTPVSTILTPVKPFEEVGQEDIDKKDEFPEAEGNIPEKEEPKPLSSTLKPATGEEEPLPGTPTSISGEGSELEKEAIASQTSAPAVEKQPTLGDEILPQTSLPAIQEQALPGSFATVSGEESLENDKIASQTSAPALDEKPILLNESEEEKEQIVGETIAPSIGEEPIAGTITPISGDGSIVEKEQTTDSTIAPSIEKEPLPGTVSQEVESEVEGTPQTSSPAIIEPALPGSVTSDESEEEKDETTATNTIKPDHSLDEVLIAEAQTTVSPALVEAALSSSTISLSEEGEGTSAPITGEKYPGAALDATEVPSLPIPIEDEEKEADITTISTLINDVEAGDDATKAPAGTIPINGVELGSEILNATEGPTSSTPVKTVEIGNEGLDITGTPIKSDEKKDEVSTIEAEVTEVPTLSEEDASASPGFVPISATEQVEDGSAQTPASASAGTAPSKTDRGSEEVLKPELSTEQSFSPIEGSLSEDKTLIQTESPLSADETVSEEEESVTEVKLEPTESSVESEKPISSTNAPAVEGIDEATSLPGKLDSDDQISAHEVLPIKPFTDSTESDESKPYEPVSLGEVMDKDSDISAEDNINPSPESPTTEQGAVQSEILIHVPSIPEEEEIIAQTVKPQGILDKIPSATDQSISPEGSVKPISDDQQVIPDTTGKPAEYTPALETVEEGEKELVSTITTVLDLAQTSTPSPSGIPAVSVASEDTTASSENESEEETVQTEAPKDDVKIQTVAEFVTERGDDLTTELPIQDSKKDEKPITTSSEEASTSSQEEEEEEKEKPEVSITTEKILTVPSAVESEESKPTPGIPSDDSQQDLKSEERPTESALPSPTTEKPILAVEDKFEKDLPKPIATDVISSEEEEAALLTTLRPLFPSINLDLTTLRPVLNASDKIDENVSVSTSTLTPTKEQPTTEQSVTSAPTSHYQPPSYGHVPPHYPSYTEDEYTDEDESEVFGPGTCRYGGKLFVSAQQIPRDDPCDFCFCFRSDIICLQQSCPPPISGCHEEPISGFCCPRYECPVSMATVLNITTSTTTTSTTLPPHFLHHAYRGAAEKNGCHISGKSYKVGDPIDSASGPCMQCTCGGDGQMKCDPKTCSPEPMLRQMIAVVASRRR